MAAAPDDTLLAEAEPRPRGVRRLRLVLGVGALFAGAALLSNIVLELPYLVVLGSGALALAVGLGVAMVRTDALGRRVVGRIALVGAVSGLVATVAYDLSKWGLSQLDPTPINPFEALPVFGQLVLGPEAPPDLLWRLGIGIHVLNGVTFGIAFAFLLGGRGVPAGIAWGLGLELFQLTLYPGWLGIDAFAEFATISAGGHLVYGAVLGGLEGRLRRVALGPLVRKRSIR